MQQYFQEAGCYDLGWQEYVHLVNLLLENVWVPSGTPCKLRSVYSKTTKVV